MISQLHFCGFIARHSVMTWSAWWSKVVYLMVDRRKERKKRWYQGARGKYPFQSQTLNVLVLPNSSLEVTYFLINPLSYKVISGLLH
jgi:hypothetical protein